MDLNPYRLRCHVSTYVVPVLGCIMIDPFGATSYPDFGNYLEKAQQHKHGLIVASCKQISNCCIAKDNLLFPLKRAISCSSIIIQTLETYNKYMDFLICEVCINPDLRLCNVYIINHWAEIIQVFIPLQWNAKDHPWIKSVLSTLSFLDVRQMRRLAHRRSEVLAHFSIPLHPSVSLSLSLSTPLHPSASLFWT